MQLQFGESASLYVKKHYLPNTAVQNLMAQLRLPAVFPCRKGVCSFCMDSVGLVSLIMLPQCEDGFASTSSHVGSVSFLFYNFLSNFLSVSFCRLVLLQPPLKGSS